MIDKNLILHFPFDDPDGNVAYDYSKNRADGTISGGAFLTKSAKFGKGLDLSGSGECLSSLSIPFSADFTLCFFIKPTSSQIGWLLNFTGINNYIEQWLQALPGNWYFIAFVKLGNLFRVYLDGQQVYIGSLTSTPIGLSMNDDMLSGSYAVFDEVQLYDVAKTQIELIKIMNRENDVEYYINDNNFKNFGVFVSESDGLIGKLKRKESLSVDWDNYHGKVVDKKRPRYEERTITLKCFIEASSKQAFIEWVNLFMAQFDVEGDVRFKVEFDGKDRPLVYEVYCPDDSDVSKKWSYNNDLMVGTFTLKLIECEPVKKVLRHISENANSVASITVTSSKLLNIYWGDGTHTFDVSGTSKNITHVYANAGEYDILITGVIEDIKNFATNAIVVWNRLL